MKPAHFLGDSLGACATSPKMPGMARATRYDLQPLIDRQTELTIPLADEDYFKQFFLELGALCWRNGLELSPGNIHRKLAERQQLQFETVAA